jgi:glycosyltransferase involved in cell wall biosynthesis
MDVLLMPYQRHVSIGLKGHDTAGWMSPMKMFEYLASGVPLISSDLPALREVLRHEGNCLLVPPDDVAGWLEALDRLLGDPAFSTSIGLRARTECLEEFTWEVRARKILSARTGH